MRSILSTEEQFIIILNSKCPLSTLWELSGETDKVSGKENADNRLISKYSIVRNVPKNFIKGLPMEEAFPFVNFEWMKSEPEKRTSLKFT